MTISILGTIGFGIAFRRLSYHKKVISHVKLRIIQRFLKRYCNFISYIIDILPCTIITMMPQTKGCLNCISCTIITNSHMMDIFFISQSNQMIECTKVQYSVMNMHLP